MTKNKKSEAQHLKTIKTLLYYLWPKDHLNLRLRVVFSMLSLIIAKALTTYSPFLYKNAIDQLSNSQNSELKIALAVPFFIILAYALSRLGAQACGEIRDLFFVKVTQHAQRRIGLITFKHLHELSLSFHLSRQTGGLSRAIERGTRAIQTVMGYSLFNILPTIVEISLVTGILLYQFPWKFGVITASTLFLYIVYTLNVANYRVKLRQIMNQMDSEANTKAIDSLLNFETVKYFTNENHEYKRFDVALEAYEKAAIQNQSSLSILNIGQSLIISTGLFFVMWMSAEQVTQKNMSVGDFVLLNTFLVQLYMPLYMLGFVYRETKQALVDMENMFELLEENPDVQDVKDAPHLEVKKGEVEFIDVEFSYSPDRPILKNITFKVPAGKSLALVGSSGAGKSTISRLLFRFYDVTKGKILIDGQDIKQVQQSSVRSAIGVVPQDTVLFNDSIGYNIRYGRPGSTDEELTHAAQLARIDEFVQKLPQKYKTPVGERGLKLSGGEKQRVAIARTILKNPKILLFDEATSALDTKTEKEIQESLRSVSLNRTSLVIAHRLSTVVDCDEILVLKEGQIVERGKHQELLSHNGEYAQMWKKQQEALKEN